MKTIIRKIETICERWYKLKSLSEWTDTHQIIFCSIFFMENAYFKKIKNLKKFENIILSIKNFKNKLRSILLPWKK